MQIEAALKTSRPIIFVAGPYRGANAWKIERNIRRAEEMGMTVAEWGGVPMIVHTMYRFFQGTLPDDFWLNADHDILRRCDAILMLQGWERSSGATAEHDLAVRLGLPVFADRTAFGSIVEINVTRVDVADDVSIGLRLWIKNWMEGKR